MKGFAVDRRALDDNAWVGAMLARDLRDGDGRIAIRKGVVLQAGDREKLTALSWDELHLILADEGDVREDEAGLRLAKLATGRGCRVSAGAASGHWPIAAVHRGILQVRLNALNAVNSIDGLAVYTLYDGQVVEAAEVVGRAKIVPFAIGRDVLERAESLARDGLISVREFLPLRVGAVVNESLGPWAADRFRSALAEKIGWLGSTMLEPAFVTSTADGLTAGISEMLHRRSDVVVVAGSRPKDPLDPAFVALEQLGAVLERRGVPAHPGSLAWLARVGEVPIVGMPSCGLFSQATVFDLLLPRLLAGERITASDLAALGHGGFLTRDMAFRFPPYRPARERGEIE